MKNYSTEEKLYNLLTEINEKRKITSLSEPVIIPFNKVSRAFDTSETRIILKKLEKDDNIISIIHITDGVIRHEQPPKPFGHVFNLNDQFNPYYLKLAEGLRKSRTQEFDNIKKAVGSFSLDTMQNYKALLNVIKSKNEVNSLGEAIKITCETHYCNGAEIDSSLVKGLIRKLENDFAVIKIIDFKEGDITGYGNKPEFRIKIIEEAFFKFFDLFKDGAAANAIQINHDLGKSLKITYSEHSREIILNDFFIISKPDFNSENEQVFDYLYKNPNLKITKGELTEDLKTTLTKDFGKIVENLKFKKDLRKAFFDISQDSIKFYNPVSKERLEALGIKNISIEIK